MICTCIYGPDSLLRDGQTALRPFDYIKNKRDTNKPFIIACGFARSHMLWITSKMYIDIYREGAGEFIHVSKRAHIFFLSIIKSNF